MRVRVGVLGAVALVLAGLGLAPASAGASVSSGLKITRSFPGMSIPVRAGTTSVKPAPILSDVPAAAAPGSTQAATIQVTYNGFSPQAQTAFQAAVNVWQQRINSPKIIHINANWTPLGAGVLGSAGPNAFYLLSDNNIYPAALAEALCNCEGSSPVEITANFNSTFPDWYLGIDGNPPASDYDFMTVVLHELGHGLGFLSSFFVSGANGGWGFDGTAATLRYDLGEWNQPSAGTKLTNTAVYANPSPALKTQLTDGTVFFEGPQVLAVNGARARLFAPNPYQPGSSNSHFDEATYGTGTVNALMTPALDNGEVIHEPGPLMLALFRDIGWTTNLPSNPNITIANVSKLEGASGVTTQFKFKVTLSAPAAGTVSVTFATADGTAVAPGDYTTKNGTLNIPAGATTGTIKVPVKGDAGVEPNETFFVNLSGAVGGTITDPQGQGTIRNDD